MHLGQAHPPAIIPSHFHTDQSGGLYQAVAGFIRQSQASIIASLLTASSSGNVPFTQQRSFVIPIFVNTLFLLWNYRSDSATGAQWSIITSPVRYIDIEYWLSIYRHFWKISISILIWSFLKISISITISIRQFWKISISKSILIRQFWKYRYRYR